MRVKEIFGQTEVTVISQKFHNERAIFIAGHRGVDAIGFNAPEVDAFDSFKTASAEVRRRACGYSRRGVMRSEDFTAALLNLG